MANDTRLNKTGLRYLLSKMVGFFALDEDLEALSDRVDDIIAEGGEPNVIETVKVNNTPLAPDAQKAVNITVPTATSELTNDGDGTQGSAFATEDYVEEYGGKIDSISVNGVAQTIDQNKNVDLEVPRVSETNTLETKILLPDEDTGIGLRYVGSDMKLYLTKYSDGDERYAEILDEAGVDNKISRQPVASTSQNGLMSSADKTKLNGVEAGAEANVQADWNQSTTTADDYIKNKPTKLSDFTNDGDGTQGSTFPTTADMEDAIAEQIGRVYQPGGSTTFANLPALSAANLGKVYNVTDAFTTTSDFKEGAGIEYGAGQDVAIINDGTEQSPAYKYNVLSGAVDLSNYWNTTNLPALTTAEIDEVWDSVFNPMTP